MLEVPAQVVRAGVLWLAAPGGRPVAAWPVWRDGHAYLLTGPGEQPLPGLAGAHACELTARSAETGGHLGTWRATVEPVAPGTEEWTGIYPVLAGKRLNGNPDPATAAILRLTPTELVEGR